MDGVGAKDDDDTGKPRQRDGDLRGDPESFARLHQCAGLPKQEGKRKNERKYELRRMKEEVRNSAKIPIKKGRLTFEICSVHIRVKALAK